MRRLLPLVPAMAVLACDPGVSGTYDLVSINGEELPVTIEFFGAETVWSGSLTLSDSTYILTASVSEDDGDRETENQSGTFTLDEFNVIRLTPGPQSSDDSLEGTWDGDQITFSEDTEPSLFGDIVFRRRPPPSTY